MAKENLKNEQYKKFIEQDILRPYQNLILSAEPGTGLGQQGKSVNFTYKLYAQIPEFATNHPEWFHLVAQRLARIYESIDVSFFPVDLTAGFLKYRLLHYGIKITYFSRF